MSVSSDLPCLRCGRRSISCICKPESTKPNNAKPSKPARVALEKKGRGGKQVTVVTGLPLTEPDLEKLGVELKRLCGAGGTVKDGCIEIQGDRRDQIVAALASKGIVAKRSG